MRDPCHYCGLKGMEYSYFDAKSGEVLIDMKDHNCPEWAPKPALSIFDTDTSFIKEAWNTQEGLERYRRGIRSGPPDDCSCRICTEEKAWQTEARISRGQTP